MATDDPTFAEHSWEPRAGGRLLVYAGPHLRENLDRTEVRRFARARKAWGILWNYDWNSDRACPWYSYVCDDPDYHVDNLESKNSRKNIRRSLERCQVRRIDAEWLAQYGFTAHVNAIRRYSTYKETTPSDFARYIRRVGAMPGVVMYGVFVDDALAAYGLAFEIGRSLRFCAAKFDPQYSSSLPMYALYYSIARDFLSRGYQDVDAGWKPLHHDTEIDEFFRRVGWRRANCRLDLYLVWWLRAALRLVRCSRGLILPLLPPARRADLESLLRAQDVAAQSGDGAGRESNAIPMEAEH